MAVALHPIVISMVWYVLIVFSPLVLLLLGMRIPRVFDGVKDRRAVRRRATGPQGQPLERLVEDLRRLRAELINDPPTNNMRRTALLMAYDRVLLDVCARLEILTGLDTEASYQEREFERLRTESAIQEAGVSLHGPRRRRAQP